MTSEKWLNIGEIGLSNLADYLLAMKQQGYCIIGAEQTAQSIQIKDLKFPKKSVLLLGYKLSVVFLSKTMFNS